MRRVLGEADEPGLRCGVRGQVRLPAVRRHGDHVDDRAGLAAADHVGHRRLHEEERRPQVHRDVAVEQLRRGVQERPAVGPAGRVHEAVDASEPLDGRGHARLRRGHVGDVGLHEHRLRVPVPTQLGGERLAHLGTTARHDDVRTRADGSPGNAGADALRPAADQDDEAGERGLRTGTRRHQISSVRCRRSYVASVSASDSGSTSSASAAVTSSACDSGVSPPTLASRSRFVGNG